MSGRLMTKEEIATARMMVAGGESVSVVAAFLGRPRGTIYNHVETDGNYGPIPEAEIERMRRMFIDENMTARQIGVIVGRAASSVQRAMYRRGYAKRSVSTPRKMGGVSPTKDGSPTTEPIGSKSKIEIMRQRYEAREPIHVDGDNDQCRGDFSESSNKEIENERDGDE